MLFWAMSGAQVTDMYPAVPLDMALPYPAGRSGLWSRRTGAPPASATRPGLQHAHGLLTRPADIGRNSARDNYQWGEAKTRVDSPVMGPDGFLGTALK
jgi:hypothetical protein